MQHQTENGDETITFLKIEQSHQFPDWANREKVVDFFHRTMKPYEDEPEDIDSAIDYMFSDSEGKGGFLVLTKVDGKLGGACLMLKTGMKGYIPEYILVFVTVDPELRGRGIGKKLIKKCLNECEGNVKLHVEYDNPAKRLYERIGFTSDYAEMRYTK